MSDIETIKSILEALYYLAAIIAIPVAIVVFVLEKRQEQRNREIDMYLQTADRYIQYLTLTLEHSDLKCGEYTGHEPAITESGFSVDQIVLYEILMMTLEQSYFLYKKSGLSADNGMSRLWTQYIVWWASRPDFRRAWKAIDSYLDHDFVEFVEGEFAKHEY